MMKTKPIPTPELNSLIFIVFKQPSNPRGLFCSKTVLK